MVSSHRAFKHNSGTLQNQQLVLHTLDLGLASTVPQLGEVQVSGLVQPFIKKRCFVQQRRPGLDWSWKFSGLHCALISKSYECYASRSFLTTMVRCWSISRVCRANRELAYPVSSYRGTNFKPVP